MCFTGNINWSATCIYVRLFEQALLAEFVGTFFLSMTVTMVSSGDVNTPYIGPGFILAAMVYALDHKSGAHFNPGITVGVVVCSFSKTSVIQGIMYIFVQTLGGVCGALAGSAIIGDAPHLPTGNDAPAGDTGSAFLVEFLFAFALVLVMLNTAVEKNAAEPNAYFGMSIGFVILAGGSIAGQISGGVFNAAVGTGLDVVRVIRGGSSHYLWIYWVATLVAGLLAGLVKSYVNSSRHFSGSNVSIFGLPIVVLIIEFIGKGLSWVYLVVVWSSLILSSVLLCRYFFFGFRSLHPNS